MKVTIFRDYPGQVENFISEFFLKNQGIKVSHVTQSSDPADPGYDNTITVSIFYEEAK